jgi:hypothetical protein
MFLRQQQYLNWLPSHGLLDFFPWHMLKVNNKGLLNVTATLKKNQLQQLPHLNDVIGNGINSLKIKHFFFKLFGQVNFNL